jgi:Uma2 family endonuclease
MILTAADLLAQLGNIPPRRVRLIPVPGTATEAETLYLREIKDHGLFELLDGTLVQKAVGFAESVLTAALTALIAEFVYKRKLGLVTSNALLRLAPKLVRLTDVSFITWNQIPDKKMPSEPIPALCSDLAVEVLRRGNTPKEMARKRREYFAAGTKLVWIIDPRKRTAAVYSSPDDVVVLKETDTLDGGDVLPGFTLPLKDLFAELDQHAE